MDLKDFVQSFYSRLSKNSLTIFTGAGLSTASGIKDFRGQNGLYKNSNNVEKMLSRSYFLSHPKEFYYFFKDNLVVNNIKPNIAHKMITVLEKEGYLNGVITQNIDGLDLLSGTENVIELHGNATRFICDKCFHDYSQDKYLNAENIPVVCNHEFADGKVCTGLVRPDIVLYEEPLNFNNLKKAEEYMDRSSTILVLGSSLVVTPASDLIRNYLLKNIYNENKKVYIVNIGKTPFDNFQNVYKLNGDIIAFTKEFNKLKKKNT